MKGKIKVWFDNYRNHVSNPIFKDNLVEKDNYAFKTTLIYDGWHAGRSSAVIHWRDCNGRVYESGMKFLDEVLSLTMFGTESKGFTMGNRLCVNATFTFKKHGTAVMLGFHNVPLD